MRLRVSKMIDFSSETSVTTQEKFDAVPPLALRVMPICRLEFGDRNEAVTSSLRVALGILWR